MDPTPEPTPNLPAVPPERRPVADPWATGRRRASGAGPDGDPGSAGPVGGPSSVGPSGGGSSSGGTPDAGPPDDSGPDWRRRLRPRNLKLAVGLGLVAAALLLLPFLDDPSRWYIPVGIGFGTLVLLYLLRLDRLLFGWAPHAAGLVLVGALVWATSNNPWSWGLAIGAGVVLAGLLLLPRWKVLAVGVAVLVVSGIGYQFRSAEITEQQAQVDAQAGNEMRMVLGVDRPQLALVSLDSGVAGNNARRVCRLVTDAALAQLTQATAAPTCEQAVAVLHGRSAGSGRVTEPDRGADPTVEPGGSVTVNGCATVWGTSAPPLGRVVLTRTDAPSPTYQVAAFQPC
ncbi:hypothetical protein [Pseudonocardia sp. KRD291]|uniref:hypothetical protein n=1 Tax=Pseudonocardia sp. KRD291 TaxID=2792007 RepID=UPI001C4A1088|nr:hypothetical protein [Pseudonocardia sp. KRD291]MBW0103081.1 hypothetical protein [Pseudonocardia sp. KRD291]